MKSLRHQPGSRSVAVAFPDLLLVVIEKVEQMAQQTQTLTSRTLGWRVGQGVNTGTALGAMMPELLALERVLLQRLARMPRASTKVLKERSFGTLSLAARQEVLACLLNECLHWVASIFKSSHTGSRDGLSTSASQSSYFGKTVSSALCVGILYSKP
jgi:hypothetical protein